MSFLRAICNFFFEAFLGCSHKRLTRPFTLKRETYKVCLDCGKQIYYSAETMRPLSMRELRRLKSGRQQKMPFFQVNTTVRALVPVEEGESNAAA